MHNKNKRVINSIIRYLVLLVVLIILFVLIWWFFSTRKKVSYDSPITPVQVVYPEKNIIKEELTLSSYVEAEAMVPVIPFVSGQILSYYAEPGKKVEKDELVAKLDSEPYALQASQARAAYLVYESTYKRLENLSKSGAVTQQQLDEVKAQLDAGKAQLELAELQESYASVKAPISGTYLMAPQSVGDIASSQAPLAVIANLDNLIVKIAVPEKYYSLISNNVNLTIIVEKPSENVGEKTVTETEVISISPYIDPRTKTFEIKAKLKTSLSSFTPGMYVLCTILLKETECFTLPIAVRKLDGSVYSVEEEKGGDKTIEKALVHNFSSLLSDSERIEVPDEFKSTPFIIRGQNSILSGQTVKITEGF